MEFVDESPDASAARRAGLAGFNEPSDISDPVKVDAPMRVPDLSVRDFFTARREFLRLITTATTAINAIIKTMPTIVLPTTTPLVFELDALVTVV